MATNNQHKKNNRKKVEAQLFNLLHSFLLKIDKKASLKIEKTIKEATKQVAKKFNKAYFSTQEKNISKEEIPVKDNNTKLPQTIKFDKIFENKQKPVKAKTPIKKPTTKTRVTLAKSLATEKPKSKIIKSNSILKKIPKEFRATISQKTTKK